MLLLELKKKCSKCGDYKTLNNFYKRKNGRRKQCKNCMKLYWKRYHANYYLENKKHILKKNSEYKKANPEKFKEYRKKFYKNNKEKFALENKIWIEKNKNYRRDYRKKYYKKNQEKIKKYRSKYNRMYYKENKDKLKAYFKRYKKENIEKYLWHNNRRKALKLNLTSQDANQEKIRFIYWAAKELEKIDGIKYHVDHIIPLSKGGLHHENNLQVIEAKNNLKKGSKINDKFIGFKYEDLKELFE